MQIREIMTRDVAIVDPEDTLQKAAKMMAEKDAGSLPVGENDRLLGMITDRDITIRGTATGKSPDNAKVRDVMSEGIRYCFDDEAVEDVAHHMAEWKVRRLAVLNREKRLVGIVSLGDVATEERPEVGAEALRGCCQ